MYNYQINSTLLTQYLSNNHKSSFIDNISFNYNHYLLLKEINIPILYKRGFSAEFIYNNYITPILNSKPSDFSDSKFLNSLYYPLHFFRQLSVPKFITNIYTFENSYNDFITSFSTLSKKDFIDLIHLTGIFDNSYSLKFKTFETDSKSSTPFTIENLSPYHAFLALKQNSLNLISETPISTLNEFLITQNNNLLNPSLLEYSYLQNNANPFEQLDNLEKIPFKEINFKNFKFLLSDQVPDGQYKFANAFKKIIKNKSLIPEAKTATLNFFLSTLRDYPHSNIYTPTSNDNYFNNSFIDTFLHICNTNELLTIESANFPQIYLTSHSSSVQMQHREQYQDHVLTEQLSSLIKNNGIDKYSLTLLENNLHPFDYLKISQAIELLNNLPLPFKENPFIHYEQTGSAIFHNLPFIYPLLPIELQQALVPSLTFWMDNHKNISVDTFISHQLDTVSFLDFINIETNNPFNFLEQNLPLFNHSPKVGNNISYLKFLNGFIEQIFNPSNSTIKLNTDIPTFILENIQECLSNPSLKNIVFENNLDKSYLFEKQNGPLLHKVFKSKIKDEPTPFYNLNQVFCNTIQKVIYTTFLKSPDIFKNSNFIEDYVNSENFDDKHFPNLYGIDPAFCFNDNFDYLEKFVSIEPDTLSHSKLFFFLLKNKPEFLQLNSIQTLLLQPTTIISLTNLHEQKFQPMETFKNTSPELILKLFSDQKHRLWEQIIDEPDWIKLFPQNIQTEPSFWANIFNQLYQTSNTMGLNSLEKIMPHLTEMSVKNNFIPSFFNNLEPALIKKAIYHIQPSWIKTNDHICDILSVMENHIYENHEYEPTHNQFQWEYVQELFQTIKPEIIPIFELIYNKSNTNIIPTLNLEFNKLTIEMSIPKIHKSDKKLKF